MTIPRIIHHIAPKNKDTWHPVWDRCYPTWQQHFPDHEHMLWNDQEDIDDLVRSDYPEYWQLYQDLPVHINRIDFARLCILHKYGGIYCDMDMFCYRNFADELTHPLHVVEAPYGDEFLENALMCSEPGHEFWSDCMQLSKDQFYSQVQHRQIKVPFNNDRATQFILTTVAGPNLICRVWRSWHQTGQVKTLPGVLYNNHGMSYHPEYRTKHMMTGMWGRESVQAIASGSEKSLKHVLAQGYMREMRKYVQLNDITVDTFDFYHDYTNGGMKTRFILNLDQDHVDVTSNLQGIQYG